MEAGASTTTSVTGRARSVFNCSRSSLALRSFNAGGSCTCLSATRSGFSLTTACTSAISTTGFSSTSGTSANPESPEATSCLAGTLVASSSTGCSFSKRAAGSTTGSSVADSPSASFLAVSVGSSVVLQRTMIPPAIMLSRSTAFNQPGKIVPLVFILNSLVLFISCHFHPRCGPICLPVYNQRSPTKTKAAHWRGCLYFPFNMASFACRSASTRSLPFRIHCS